MASTTKGALAVESLQALANDSAQTLQQLENVLDSLAGSDEQAQWAAEALENCEAPAASQCGLLIEATAHPSELVASWACILLARLGSAATAAEKPLAQAVQSRTETLVREEAARALGTLGALSPTTREILSTAAAQGSPRLKRFAVTALGN